MNLGFSPHLVLYRVSHGIEYPCILWKLQDWQAGLATVHVSVQLQELPRDDAVNTDEVPRLIIIYSLRDILDEPRSLVGIRNAHLDLFFRRSTSKGRSVPPQPNEMHHHPIILELLLPFPRHHITRCFTGSISGERGVSHFGPTGRRGLVDWEGRYALLREGRDDCGDEKDSRVRGE